MGIGYIFGIERLKCGLGQYGEMEIRPVTAVFSNIFVFPSKTSQVKVRGHIMYVFCEMCCKMFCEIELCIDPWGHP